MINSRITNVFKKKISTLHTAFKRASKSGGNALKKLVNGWKNGQKYRFKVFYNEVDVLRLKSECDLLRGEKRALEESVTQETVKRICLEDKLQSALEKAGKREEANKKRFKRLAKKVAEMNFEKRSRGPAKKKSFGKYTRQHQARVKNQLKEQCHATLSFLGLYDYVATKIDIYNEDTGKHETFSLLEEGELPFTDNKEKEMTDEELDDLNMWMYLKDKFNISNEAWREFSVKAKDIPTLSRMTKRINELNSSWNLSPTPGEAEGVQIKFEDSLRKQIERLDLKEETIKVKLSGDGTQIGKRLKIVNFTYTILNEKEMAMAERGNYILAIIKTNESYERLQESLSDLRHEMESLKKITINNCTYNIEYFLGGDWKFLACVCGLGAANQDYACIWCKCPRMQRWDMSKQWSLSDLNLGARNLEQISKCAKSKQYNCKKEPLFPFIPLDHVVIDTLHLFLRISDNLIELLIRELKRQDAIEKKVTFNDGFPRDKYKHMAGYEAFLQNLGISFQWNIGKDSKKLEYRDLTGPEKLKVFENIQISALLPNATISNEIQKLWADFMDIVGDLKLDFPSDVEIMQFKHKIKTWFDHFLKQYQTKDVTPYMHALHAHVPEFLKLYKNIAYYTQQGMEKYNDRASKDYFRSTNHRGVAALKQLFLKKHRIQYLEAAGYMRVKTSYTCSNCGNIGHTIKTCTSNCMNCEHPTFCSHLAKINGKWTPKCKTLSD